MSTRTSQAKQNGKAPPLRISEHDLAERQKIVERSAELQQIGAQLENALAENQRERLKLEGRWEQWRDGIDARYQMDRQDAINDEGEIVRAGG